MIYGAVSSQHMATQNGGGIHIWKFEGVVTSPQNPLDACLNASSLHSDLC